MDKCKAASAFLFGLMVLFLRSGNNIVNGNSDGLCITKEREALVKFKKDVIDPSSRLSSWNVNQKDCCQWVGVSCDNSTGHVLELHLQNPNADYCEGSYGFSCDESSLGGKINPSLLDLKRLSHLDLSYNNFEGLEIPGFMGSFTNLRHLDLSKAGFGGLIPQQIGNLSILSSLILSGRKDHTTTLGVQDLHWLSKLHFLKILDLSFVNLSKASDWLEKLIMLDSIQELYLASCDLNPQVSLPPFNNFTSLFALDVSFNNFGPSVPRWILSITTLDFLSLMQIGISGPIPYGVRNMSDLQFLDLSYNFLDSSIPKWLGNLSSLIALDLTSNHLSGSLPESIGHLSKLKYLLFSNNLLEGTVSELHFANLTSIISLYASENELTLRVSPDWHPPFQLQDIELRTWKLGPRFPPWLRSQNNLLDVDLSCTQISDSVPIWFWDLSSQFFYLNLSHNELHGEIPNIAKSQQVTHSVMYLNSNKFNGLLPRFPPNLRELDVSRNSISGNLSNFLCDKPPHELKILHLGDNHFSGVISDCLENWLLLEVLMLGNNNFTGNIPRSIGLVPGLRSLHLRNNSLSEGIPSSLQKCKKLKMIDLSMNEFVGNIPKWVGNTLTEIMILILRSNKLSNEIPLELCQLASLQILDLSNNFLSGKMPKCFNNLSAMARVQSSSHVPITYAYYGGEVAILENAFLITKGLQLQYDNILSLMMIVDLSSNGLSGDIPEELTFLKGLRALNLSKNHLSGVIPRSISNMGLLESLDLSSNHLYGKIPSSIASLNFLNYLNVSFNELFGRIPTGTQLQSFNASSFVGNKLCGPPLLTSCNKKSDQRAKDNDPKESKDFFVSMVIGSVVGFWGVIGPLLYSRSWRYKYYAFLEIIWCRVYVYVMRRFRNY